MSQIDTRYTPLRAVAATNVTTTSDAPTAFTTITTPTGDQIIDMGVGARSGGAIQFGALLANGLKLIPFGAGSAGNSFNMSVFSWDITLSPIGAGGIWVATLLASFTCTLNSSSVTGIANTDLNASQFLCDTIAINTTAGHTQNLNVSSEMVNPGGGGVPGHIVVDAKGAALIGVYFNKNTATSANALYKVY